MPNSPVPLDPEALTLEWINEILGERDAGPAASLDVQPFAVGMGAYSELYRVRLRYLDGRSGPQDLIAKFPRSSPELRREIAKTRAYELEHAFYRDLAADTPIRTPECYFSHHDPETHQALVLMEHVKGTSGDQVAGASRSQAQLAVREAARLHRHWAGSGLADDYGWLRSLSDPGMLAAFEVGPELIETGREAVRGFAPRWLLDRAGDSGRVMTEQLRQLDREPRTLLHVDYRLDNMIFSEDGTEMTLIDWQQVYWGPGLWDIGLFMSQSLDVADRRNWGPSLVETYLSERDPGRDRSDSAWLEPLQRVALFCAFNCIRAGGLLDLSLARSRHLLRCLTERACPMVEDFDALALL